MSTNLKKELTEALNALENKEPKDNSEIMRVKKKALVNSKIKQDFPVKDGEWCWSCNQPIIDIEGGE